MQKINIINTETIVDKSTIIHTIEFEIYISEIPQWEIIKNIPAIYDFIYLENDVNKVSRAVKFTVKGKSTCMDKDTFDETKGKHIAITRAQENLHRTLEKFYQGIFTAINNLLVPIHHCIYHHWQKGFNCDVHLEKDILNNEDREYLGYK